MNKSKTKISHPYKVVKEGDYLIVKQNDNYQEALSIVGYKRRIYVFSIDIDKEPNKITMRCDITGKYVISDSIKRLGKSIIIGEKDLFKPRMEYMDQQRILTPEERVGNAILSKQDITKQINKSTITSKVWLEVDHWLNVAFKYKSHFSYYLHIEILRSSCEFLEFYLYRYFILNYDEIINGKDKKLYCLMKYAQKIIKIEEINENIYENRLYKNSEEKNDLSTFVASQIKDEEKTIEKLNEEYRNYILEKKELLISKLPKQETSNLNSGYE